MRSPVDYLHKHDVAAMLMRRSRYPALGALAGAAGTAAMDLVLYRRYREQRRRGLSVAVGVCRRRDNWDQASASGKLGEKLERTVTGQQPPDEWARPRPTWCTGPLASAEAPTTLFCPA
jgi:hypothetical protein